MKLNFDILVDYLPGSYRTRIFGSRTRKLIYNRPLLYVQGRQMDPGTLYIAPTHILPRDLSVGSAVICVGGQLPQNWHAPGVSLLHIENSNDLAGTLRDVFAVYDRIEQWDSLLRDELEAYETSDLQRMMTLTCEALGHDLGICDSDLRNLYFCTLERSQEGPEQWRFYDHSRNPLVMDVSSWDSINSVCIMESKITEPYLTAAPNQQWESYCCNLRYQGRFMGCISFTACNRLFRESDFSLMDRVFVYLKKALFRYVSLLSWENPPEITALCAILDGKPVGGVDMKHLILEGNWFVLVKLQEEQGCRSLPLDYMCSNINAFLPGWLSAVRYHDEIIGLIRFEQGDRRRMEELLISFEDTCRRMGYHAGMSEGFQSLYAAQAYYMQACYAVERGSREPGQDRRIHRFRDHTLQYLLDTCLGTVPRESVLPPGLRELMAHDEEKGSEYVRTLDVFLQTECNASQTAERLFIHRSSFV